MAKSRECLGAEEFWSNWHSYGGASVGGNSLGRGEIGAINEGDEDGFGGFLAMRAGEEWRVVMRWSLSLLLGDRGGNGAAAELLEEQGGMTPPAAALDWMKRSWSSGRADQILRLLGRLE